MAPVTQRRFANLDDEDVLDDFDPAYFPRRVYKDGRGPRVRLMLTDAAPSYRSSFNDVSAHRPHQIAATDSAQMRDAQREAARSYEARNDFLRDAWRSKDNPPPPPLRDGQSPRDAYIERLQSAYRTPTGGNGPADEVEALQKRWASAGATAGPGRRPAQDAATGRAEADQAYAEYCARLQSAWKTR